MRILITGPSGSGKSSVIDKLKHDYQIIPEVAREWFPTILSEGILETYGRQFVQQLIEVNQIKNFVQYKTGGIFDRGLPDEIAYRIFYGLEVTEVLLKHCQMYRYDKIFFFPYWDEIYVNDEIRKETPEQAQKLEQLLRYAYRECGYNIIEVPKVSIKERVQFIIDRI